LHSN